MNDNSQAVAYFIYIYIHWLIDSSLADRQGGRYCVLLPYRTSYKENTTI